MKIAFDGQLLLSRNKTGIAWNAHYLILELLKYNENEYTMQCFQRRHAADRMHELEQYQQAGCSIEYCTWFHYVFYKLIWLIFPVPYRCFFPNRADITQFFNFAVPPGASGRRVTFIYDMAYKSCPKTVDPKTRVWLEMSMKKSCRRADHIVTVSAFSKREIIKYLHVPEEKITVVPSAADPAVYHTDYSRERIQEVLNKYQIRQEYILYLGTIEPRKNLARLIGAYESLCRERTQTPQLVLAGKKGWLYREIYEKVRRLDAGSRILFTGYVEPEDGPVLMRGAKMFVFPSLYEGFGMPPLEAMACGTPVITSNTTALAEVAGDAGITVNPENEAEICRAMHRLLEDDLYRKRLVMRGLKRAKAYTWAESAAGLMEVYQKVAGNDDR